MRRVPSHDTTPERTVRKLLFSLGYRYRLHDAKLPGRPDIVFPGRRKVIFVHGCFWHRHQGCPRATTPNRNARQWIDKFEKTVDRDRTNAAALADVGWKVHVVWECEVTGHYLQRLQRRLMDFLEDSSNQH